MLFQMSAFFIHLTFDQAISVSVASGVWERMRSVADFSPARPWPDSTSIGGIGPQMYS